MAGTRVVIDIDASAIITTREISMRFGNIVCIVVQHPHDKWLFAVVRIAHGEVANVGVWPCNDLAIRDIVV